METEFATPEITLTAPQTQVRNFKLRKKINFNHENFFEKITKNVISGKLQDFEQSYSEARFATP